MISKWDELEAAVRARDAVDRAGLITTMVGMSLANQVMLLERFMLPEDTSTLHALRIKLNRKPGDE